MRSKFFGAAAAAILASSLSVAMAQAPSQQPPDQAQPAPAMPATPAPAPDSSNSMMQMQPKADEAATPVVEHPKQHQMSACQKAILASEKALKKSQASPDTIAQAWQHIETAKQEKGSACKDEAKQAQEML